jgi:hypothetical protein
MMERSAKSSGACSPQPERKSVYKHPSCRRHPVGEISLPAGGRLCIEKMKLIINRTQVMSTQVQIIWIFVKDFGKQRL